MPSDSNPVRRTGTSVLSDPSMWGIVLANLFTLVLAYVQHWDIGPILWVYWLQSVIIGITNVIRMLRLKSFTTKGLKMNNKPVSETASAKRQVAIFFLFHYGFFHFIYAVFLMAEQSLYELSRVDSWLLLLIAASFVISHFFSLFYNAEEDFKDKKPNLGTLMFYPYLRIIPMHLTIIFGSIMGSGTLFLFMLLKTLSDAGMHMVEHALFRKPDIANTLQ